MSKKGQEMERPIGDVYFFPLLYFYVGIKERNKEEEVRERLNSISTEENSMHV